MSRVFDCFSVWRETELLDLRLRLLWPYVDFFVIAESDRTPTGHVRQPMLERFVAERPWLKPKVRGVVVPGADESPEDHENRQRDALTRGYFDATADDVVIISNVEELPRPDSLTALREPDFGFTHFGQSTMLFRFNLELLGQPVWWGPLAFRRGLGATPLQARDNRVAGSVTGVNARVVEQGGWRFSYLGDPDIVATDLPRDGNLDPKQVQLDVAELIRKRRGILGEEERTFAHSLESFFPPSVARAVADYPQLVEWNFDKAPA